MTEIEKYKVWLRLVAKEFKVSQMTLISKERTSAKLVCSARQAFYWLCFRDNINIYKLSTELGKHRTTICRAMKRNVYRSVDKEKKIWENAKSRGITERIRTPYT